MSLLENLAGQKYILLTFMKEWLSVTDLGRLLVLSFSKKSRYPTLFANYEHNIIQKFFEMAKISDLKAFMHKSICSEFFSAISQDEEIRVGIYKALTHPDADPEYRSLAVTFLSGCAFTFVLPNDEHGKDIFLAPLKQYELWRLHFKLRTAVNVGFKNFKGDMFVIMIEIL